MHELVRRASSVALSLLAGDQEALAQHFARGVPPIALWHGIGHRPGTTGAPLLDGAVGWLECETRSEVPAGTHTLFVGEVTAWERGRAGPALVRIGGAYAAV